MANSGRYYTDSKGVLYDKKSSSLVRSSIISGTYTVKKGTKKIKAYAFGACKNLKKVIIPASVTDMVAWVFPNDGKNVTLVVEKGSYAEEFAKTNHIKYEYR